MKHCDPRRGIVLVTVLWSITLLSALAMAAAATFRGFVGIMAIDRDRVQGAALLTAGLETAASVLGRLGERPLLDMETFVTLSTGSVRARLSDEGGRIDIGKAPVEVLAGLFRAVGAGQPDDMAKAVVAWRNAGTAERSQNDTGSPRAAPGQSGASLPFTDVRQLANVPGVSAEWAAAVTPLATVFGSETVNPLTAPWQVIAALPGVDASHLETFMAARRSFPADAASIAAAVGPAQRYLAVKPQPVASVQLTTQLTDGYSAAAGAVIVSLPQDREPYRVLVWNPLPPASAR